MEPVALRCPSCAAAVAREDLRCRHCGSQLATVACPRCFALVPLGEPHCGHCGAEVSHQARGAGGPCPACQEALTHTVHGAVEMDQCLRCGGVWMARTVFQQLSEDRELQVATVGYLPPAGPSTHAEPIHYRPCPACARFMNRTNYGKISGVIVDVCKEDGVWFDANELRRVMDFIQAGGLEKSRDRQLRELEDAKRQLAQAARPEYIPASSDWTRAPGDPGSALVRIAFDIFDLFT